MTDEQRERPGIGDPEPSSENEPDARDPSMVDVVEGPVGSARLREPQDVEGRTPDADPLPGFEPPDVSSTDD